MASKISNEKGKGAGGGRRRESAAERLTRENWARNPGFLITDLRRLIVLAVDQQFASLNLTNAQLRVLLHLDIHEGVTQVALAQTVGIKKASLGVLIDRLEEKGLVERRHDPKDRRARLIHLSGAGRALFGPIFERGTEVMNALMRGIDERERDLLVDLLLRMKANAAELAAAAPGDRDAA